MAPPRLPPSPLAVVLPGEDGPFLVAWGRGELVTLVAGFPLDNYTRAGQWLSSESQKGGSGSLTPLALRATEEPWLPPPLSLLSIPWLTSGRFHSTQQS